ncbi:hypothetical protein [Comamonas aquatica]|uniref:hypothetical protein n=1 Tax=Comamonas aquatica TaxID=225991 RepID=UPI0039196AF6
MMRWDVAGFVGAARQAMPIRWVVQGPNALQPDQRAQLQARLQNFLTQCRLSRAPTQWANGALPDGSRYRLYAHNGAVQVVVEPRSATDTITNYVAWPVFYEPGYVAPLYEREFIEDDEVPLGYILESATYQKFSVGGDDLGFFLNTRVMEIHIRDFTFTQTWGFTPTLWDDVAYGVHSFAGVLPGVVKNIGGSYGDDIDQSYSYYYRIDSVIVQDHQIAISASLRTEAGGWVASAYNLAIPRRAEDMGLFDAGTGTERWRGLCSGTVTTHPSYSQVQADISVDVEGTIALCDAILEQLRIKPHPRLAPERIEGRNVIGNAVSAWCKQGLGNDAHRNARILRFPYLTQYRPKDASVLEMLKQGSVSAPVTTAVGADRNMIKQVTRQSISNAAHRMTATPWKGLERGQELVALTGFRSGVVNAALSKLIVSDPGYHAAEPPQHVVEAFSSEIPSWMVTAQSQGLEKVPQEEQEAQGAPVVFDEQIPVGTALVLVHLEYEVFDPYTGQWIWCAVPRMVKCDAVWVTHLYRHAYVGPEGEPAIRAVRSSGATKYVRTRGGWSGGAPVPLAAWGASYVTTDIDAPPAVAIAINLPAEAYPASTTSEGVLWKGGKIDASALRKLPLTGVSHLCAHALKIAGVDKRS